MNMMKRMLSLLLALALLMGNIPAVVFAEETEIPAETEMVAAEETLAPTEAETEPAASTEAATEPAGTVTPTEVTTEPTVEETVAPTQPAVPEETAAPTEVEADLLEGTVPGEDALAGTSSVVASGICGDNLTWMLDDEGTLTISGTGEMTGNYWREEPYKAMIISVVIEDGITNISEFAFGYCENLRDVIIADTVTTINRFAFEGCHNLKEIALPNHLTAIGDGAFHNNSGLTSIKIPDSVTDLGEYVLELCDNLTNVTLPGKITSIPMMMFHGCSSLKTINIPDSVTNIGESAFGACWNLTSIYIPDGVTSIGDSAFWNCNSLTSVTIPDSLTSIGEHAFKDCDSLTEITFKGHAPEIGEDVFLEVIATAYYPANNPTWTADVMQNYGGRIIWKSYGGENEPTETEPEATEPAETEPVEDENIVASGTCGDNLTWTLENGVLTISGTGDMDSYNEEFAGPWYAYRSNITSVMIEEGVTSIGDWAFLNCTQITSVEIPDSMTSIGEGAFNVCRGLTNITIPESVTSIGAFVFGYCSSLKKITFEGDMPAFGGTDVFEIVTATAYYPANNATWTADVMQDYGGTITWIPYTRESDSEDPTEPPTEEPTGPPTEVPTEPAIETPTEEPTEAPTEPVKDEIVVAAGTCGANLTWTLDDEGTLTISGTGPMNNYYASGQVPWYSSKKSIKTVVISDGVTTIGSPSLFGYCDSLTSVTIGNGVTVIGKDAFSVCKNLKSVTIGNNVTSIGDSAFQWCEKLENITLPDSVTRIGDLAFYGCDNLTKITIPASVTSIGSLAFYSCEKLKDVHIEDLHAWMNISFEDCTSNPLCTNFPSENGSKHNLYLNGELVTEATFPDGMTSIIDNVFCGYSRLESVTLPDSVTSIGDYAFSACTNLKTITIPGSVISIGEEAFSYCDSLKTIIIPDSVTSIGERAFWYSHNLKNVEMGNGVTSIGAGAFNNCSRLTSIALPDGITTINGGVFCKCSRLKSVTIPDSVTSIGDMAFAYCSKLTNIKMPASLTRIVLCAFASSGLESITIPDGVTKIEEEAFYGCKKLSKIVFKGDAPKISKNTFDGVTAKAYYPLNNSTWTKDVRKNYGGKLTWIEKCTNHTIVIQEATEVTCTTDGVTEGSYCSNCNEVLATQAVTPALGHNVEQWVIDRETTYTVAGERHGNCERCGELVVETLDALGLPKPVVTVAANEKTGGGTLSWEHDGEADYYEVYRATSKSGKYKLLETVEGTELEVKVSVGKTYYYKVKAICKADSSLNSGYSSVVKVTGKCAQPEIAVAPVPASGKPCVKGYEVSGAEEYEIYRSTNATEGFKKIKTTSKSSYTDSKAELGTTYYYKVKAIASKSTYNSVFSEIDSCLTILAQPDAELSINKTTGKPVIEWEKVSGAIGYEILRAESEKGEYTKLANQTELTFEDCTAEPDKDYWYKVNAIAENTDLNSIDVTGHQQMIHATLAQPKVTFGINSITGKPVMTWEEVDGAVEYKIYRSSKSKESYKCIETTTDLSYSDDSVKAGKGYYYKVIAIGENCKSAYSSNKKLTAKCAQPEITVEAGATGKPAVKWDKVSGAKKYEVYRATEIDGTYKKVKTTTSTSYTDSKAELGKTYYYKVKAIASKSTYNSGESEIDSCLTILAQPELELSINKTTGKPVIEWEKISGAVSYELYRSENGGEFELISTQTELTYTDENTVVDGAYCYKVKAIANDPALNSTESSEESIYCACAKPKANIALDGKKPMVSWDSVEGATKYYVYRSTKKSSGYKKVATVEPEDGTSYRDSKAKKGTTYYYKIVAVSENAKSAYSNVVKIKSK